MALGYDGKLYILAFDHRGSFQKKMFGIEGEPSQEETDTISDAKKLIYEGMEIAVERGVDADATGVLVDEQFGSDIPTLAREHGLKLAQPVEKSGQEEFDFQYGEDFGKHIEANDPDFNKVLVRLNPEGDAEMNERQLGRLKGSRTGCMSTTGCSSSSSSCPRRTSSSSPWAATPTATTPSCAPSSCGARSSRSRTSGSRSTSGRSRASSPRMTPRC